jgi:hypothetical protein
VTARSVKMSAERRYPRKQRSFQGGHTRIRNLLCQYVAHYVNLDKMPELSRETFTA